MTATLCDIRKKVAFLSSRSNLLPQNTLLKRFYWSIFNANICRKMYIVIILRIY